VKEEMGSIYFKGLKAVVGLVMRNPRQISRVDYLPKKLDELEKA